MWHVADSTVHYNILCDMSRDIRDRGREIRETETMGMEMGYVLRSVLVCCCYLTHYPFVARLLICLAMFSSSADGVICDLCARQQNLNKSITCFLLRSAVCSLAGVDLLKYCLSCSCVRGNLLKCKWETVQQHV